MIKLKEPFFNDTKSVALYGAGNIGRDVLNLMTGLGVNVRCFLDHKDLPVQQINGVPIYKPDDEQFSAAERNETCLILSFFNAYVSVPALLEKLNNLGWKNIVTFPELHKAFPMELGRRFWLTDLNYYNGKEAHYEAASRLWADEKSKELYERLLKFRLTLDYSLLAEPDTNRQYFPSDVPAWEMPLAMIDCGAYDGDTLRELAAQRIAYTKIAAFEPDMNNFSILSTESRSMLGDISLFPCGVWSHCCQLRFASGGGSGSAISSGGDTVIQCVSLDEAIPHFGPNLIKMDIEGAEYAALLGARNMIAKHRPGLAICLYHNPEHLWQIPLLIAEWSLSYDFYLRCYSFSGFELVMYAIPRAIV